MGEDPPSVALPVRRAGHTYRGYFWEVISLTDHEGLGRRCDKLSPDCGMAGACAVVTRSSATSSPTGRTRCGTSSWTTPGCGWTTIVATGCASMPRI
jgi:hypothetical protein